MKPGRVNSRAIFFSLFLLLLINVIENCSRPNRGEPSFVFLVTLDTTRADYIDYSLTNNDVTPNLAKLASYGQYFKNAYALIPITLPSHASMFYSLPPHHLKLYNNGQVQKIHYPTVTQLLRRDGYITGAVISLGVLKADFGLNKGFDHYLENFKPYLWDKPADAVNQDVFRLIRHLTRQNDERKRFFFWIHYSDPHEPYFPPYEGGNFRISVNGRDVFISHSTEQPIVNLEIQAKPGKNKVILDFEIPANFKDYPGCTVEYIKYRDFSLEPQNNLELKEEPEIFFPAHWNRKKTQNSINYYSNKKRSEIIIRNRLQKVLLLNLRFICSLRVDDASRKLFYREEVKYMDHHLGELLEFLKQENIYEKAAFIIIGDHGEVLGEYRNHFGHIHFLNQTSVKVPLIIAGKGIPAEGMRDELVSTLGIAPTILEITGIKKPGFMLGKSLLTPGSVSGVKLLLETYSPEANFDAFSIIDYPYQVIFYPGRRVKKMEFFNLENDPLGLHPIRDSSPDGKKGGKTRDGLVHSLLKISRIIMTSKGKIISASKRHQEILKSLGYL
jgi:arylsulfatase A-like enzyme